MKLFCALALAAMSLPAAVNPQLKQVNSVYILGMSGGLDQFLANQLTASGIFQVVTDPQKADAILTDRIGEPLESKLKELYPPPPPPEPEKKDDDADKTASGKDAKDKNTAVEFGTGTARLTSSFNKGKGNLFLVDRKSRAVLWSVYELPKDSTPGELTKIAKRVVKQLAADLSDKKPSGQ
ncbi:MAG: hypothetical protein LAP38_18945 [Acidobacteriia bacterium]|nr:hypothetical protein [Terriglobia bacterium]